MFAIKDFSFGYNNQNLVEGLNLQVDFPEVVIVLGNNGSGKSSFFNALRGENDFYGELIFNDSKIKNIW